MTDIKSRPKTGTAAKTTIQNPNDYFHYNIFKKFNVMEETQKDNLKLLKTQLSYTDRVLTMKNLTGSQKRKFHNSVFNYPELNWRRVNRLDLDFEERKEFGFVMSMLKTK